ncbi:MAG: ABC transporter permease [Thermoanaerobaculia bacterium]|nr:ABC transporter permease [Thermoanaerobaculia bacterium]
MTRFLLRRLAGAVLLLFLVLTATFLVLHLAPGDPGSLLSDPRIPASQRQALQELWKLDRPLASQYLSWLWGTIRGEWGTSFLYRRPVTEVIASALPHTLILGLSALGIQLLLGVPLGLWAARKRGSLGDRLLRIGSSFLYAVPLFWLALMALALLSFRWGVFPPSHALSVEAAEWPAWRRLLDLFHHLALPALVLGIGAAGGWLRLVRSGLRETLEEPFVRTARAKGLPEHRVLWVHAVRPTLAPWLQLLGLTLPGLLSGALVVEVIFAWPGLGRIAWTGLMGRDYPIVLACTAWSGALVILGNLVADLLAAASDPRLRETVR